MVQSVFGFENPFCSLGLFLCVCRVLIVDFLVPEERTSNPFSEIFIAFSLGNMCYIVLLVPQLYTLNNSFPRCSLFWISCLLTWMSAHYVNFFVCDSPADFTELPLLLIMYCFLTIVLLSLKSNPQT